MKYVSVVFVTIGLCLVFGGILEARYRHIDIDYQEEIN